MNTTNYINKFLNEIKNTKNLSEKTIKAYKSDLIDFFLFIALVLCSFCLLHISSSLWF